MRRAQAPRLLVDVSQYVRWPAVSGVQRALGHLAHNWDGHAVDARYGFIEDGSYVTGPFSELGSLVASTFRADERWPEPSTRSRSRDVRDALLSCSNETVRADRVEAAFDAYLLPEPTLHEDSLAVAMHLRSVAFFIYYDALPLTHPQFFEPSVDGRAILTRYHLAVVGSENVAYISESSRRTFEQRIARRKPTNGIVVRPGADGLQRKRMTASGTPTFAVVGTVEPRKRHRVIIDAFEQLWSAGRDYELVVLGGRGPGQADLLERLEALSEKSRALWIEVPDDDVVSDILARSSAMVFASDAEGYGLPPLEALAIGCPVIVSANLPALEGLEEAGQIRLPAVTTETLRSAVETLADPTRNAVYRQAIQSLDLPTWKEFARKIEDWVTSVSASNASPMVPEGAQT